jgi:hypothetical protein
LSQFVHENFPSPQTIEEAVDFLSDHFCEFYSSIFEKSMEILIGHFSEIRFDQFLKIPNMILEQLFQSPQLQVDHEDILCDLVIDLIGRDPNRKSLLKLIYFPGVSSSHLINYFNNFRAEEIDYNLFESIKIQLFCDVLKPDSLPASRWLNPLTLRSKGEIDEIFKLIQIHFHQTSNPVQPIQFVDVTKKHVTEFQDFFKNVH